ncbi:hypothetical protein ACD591_16860 [Rufibacter glacialis]|uniref:Cupin domain-containing protein n=1 Tax=Rufibacter glacialis TaxID=1259555 RepID=A0A5M8QDZ5_9BACT|nr:hypothetical protein [Rufibacter glacialis]KAA6434257.1 hypothetical protein FOE74_08595 [Rufibacter glacialis]GGK68107.1 hypothetical protein GCM10011405_15160 [Rufibacter glacialis]
MITAYKLFAGEDGHSYFQKGTITEKQLTGVEALHFKETPADYAYDWHTAPTTQYVLTLSGTLQFTTSLGATFIIHPGDVLIAMDTVGSGHKWRMLGDEPWKRAYVVFQKDTQINFVPDEGE